MSLPVTESTAFGITFIGRRISLRNWQSITQSSFPTENDFHHTYGPATSFTRYAPGVRNTSFAISRLYFEEFSAFFFDGVERTLRVFGTSGISFPSFSKKNAHTGRSSVADDVLGIWISIFTGVNQWRRMER